jgi:hypothetical protein
MVIADTGCANLNSGEIGDWRHDCEPVVSRDPEGGIACR